MTKPNLAFYTGLLESMRRSVATFQEIVNKERAEKEEALQLVGELESIVQLKDAEIAKLKGEIAQMQTGLESEELEQLSAIGEKIEDLHNAISSLNNPTAEEEPESEEEDEDTEIEAEVEEEV